MRDFAVIEKVLEEKTVRGKKQYLVKYEGYPPKFNEWISAAQMRKNSGNIK